MPEKTEEITLETLIQQAMEICDKKGWDYFNFGGTFFVHTPYSGWMFEIRPKKVVLFHQSFGPQPTQKFSMEYHDQNKSFELNDLPDLFDYINNHDYKFLKYKSKEFGAV